MHHSTDISVSGSTVLLLLIFITAPSLIHCDDTWKKLDVQCIAESVASIDQVIAISEIQCVMKASFMLVTGLLVLQFNKDKQVCRIFRYQSICRQLVTGQSEECLTFCRFPINPKSIDAKLSNLWLADDLSRLDNLVCQIDEDTNRFYPLNTQWASDGLKFDGTSSYMVLNKSSIGFTGGLTWLLRIKRQPQVQVYFEFIECSTLESPTTYGTTMWEYNYPRMLHVVINYATGPTRLPQLFSGSNQLSSSVDDWVNIGFTTDPAGNYKLFYNNSFLPTSSWTASVDPTAYTTLTHLCISFGKRFGDARLFNGTLRAMALANVTMSEADIQQFYSMIP